MSDGVPPARESRRVARGAWYPDPFEVEDERWWDGSQWTDEVRSLGEARRAAPLRARPVKRSSPATRPRRAEAPSDSPSGELEAPFVTPSTDLRAPDFPVGIEALVGEQLSIVPSLRKPGLRCQVLASAGRVGSIGVFGHQLARLTCAHGAWFLKKRRGDTSGFTIESSDHTPVGRYRSHHWKPGGVIRLSDGTEVELQRSLPGRWKVRSADGNRCLAEVHQPVLRSAQREQLKVTIHALPPDGARASILILAACALLMLHADAG